MPRIGFGQRPAFFVALLVALGGTSLVVHGSIQASRAQQLARLEGALARSEAASFASSLEGEAVAKQMVHFEARRESYRRFAAARRERALGAFLVIAGLLAAAAAHALSRIGRELPADRSGPLLPGG